MGKPLSAPHCLCRSFLQSCLGNSSKHRHRPLIIWFLKHTERSSFHTSYLPNLNHFLYKCLCCIPCQSLSFFFLPFFLCFFCFVCFCFCCCFFSYFFIRVISLLCVISKLRSCVKVEVAILGSPSSNSPYGVCGRKATLSLNLRQNDVSLVL